jgi:hypothetical protein
MTTLQAFILGMMMILTPCVVLLAFMLMRGAFRSQKINKHFRRPN